MLYLSQILIANQEIESFDELKEAIKEAGRMFTTRRMVQDYVRKYYVPALQGDAAGDDPPIR